MNVFEMVMNYFKENEGVKYYEPVGVIPDNNSEQDYLYRVIAQYTGNDSWKKGTYAVWTSFNITTQSLNYGHYDMSYKSAMKLFKGEEEKPISWNRLSELATKFKDGLEQDDKEEALKYFTEKCEMTDEELKYFGIEKPKKYKRVKVEVNFDFEMVLPEEADEDYYVGSVLDLGSILSDGCGERIYTDVKEEGIDTERAERMLNYEDYYGELNLDYC